MWNLHFVFSAMIVLILGIGVHIAEAVAGGGVLLTPHLQHQHRLPTVPTQVGPSIAIRLNIYKYKMSCLIFFAGKLYEKSVADKWISHCMSTEFVLLFICLF
jgi:hypothetical protein